MDTTNEITPENSFVPVYLIPMTEEEIAASEYNSQLMADQDEAARLVAEAKQSAIAKLSKLGLTEDEIAAITNA